MAFDIGYDGEIEIREFMLMRDPPLGITILYVSDLHLNGFCTGIVRKVQSIIEQHKPDLLLLGGDYVDTRNGIKLLRHFLEGLSNSTNVLAIAGNHDYFFGIDVIKEIIRDHGITWLEKSSTSLIINGRTIRIDGNLPQKMDRGGDLTILCLHKPMDIDDPYDLVLAGHLHGSQVVLWQNEKGLYPGRFFYKWNLLEKKFGDSLYAVSKGVGDTLPVRYNCKRDVLLIRV